MVGKQLKENFYFGLNFLKKINLKKRYFFIPLALSLAAALSDGLSMGLLIPLVDGLITRQFASAYNTPFLKQVLMLFPDQIKYQYISMLILMASIVFCVAVLNQVFRYLSGCSAGFLAIRTANNLRKKIFEKYIEQGKRFFDKAYLGHLNTVLHEFTHNISSNLATLNQAFTQLFVSIIYLGMLFFLNWRITIGVIILLPLTNRLFRGFLFRIKKSANEYRQHIKTIARKAIEIFSNIILIKVDALEPKELAHYNQLSNDIEKNSFRRIHLRSLLNPLQRIMMLFFFVVVVLFIALRVEQAGSVEISRMIIYCAILRELILNYSQILDIKRIVAELTPMSKEIISIINMGAEDKLPEGVLVLNRFSREIEMRDLSFGYEPGREVLKGIDLIVRKGETVAIVGATGSGKTTIIYLLLRLYDCPPGTILIDGKDIRDYQIISLLRHMALVSQDSQLFHETLRYNITYGHQDVSEKQLARVVQQARLEELIDSLPSGLDTVIGDQGVRLSGGEKQRVAIARALLKDAEILILDEATSALDAHTETLVHEAIDEASKGRTVIMIAHRLSTIEKADRIYVVEDGRVVEQGGMAELLKQQGVFYAYWKQQKG